MTGNQQILIAELPAGPLNTGHFEQIEGTLPVLTEGQLLVETQAITIGAGQRAGLQGSARYATPAEPNIVMAGTGLGRVELSRDPSFAPGDLVIGPTGWQRWAAIDASSARRVPPEGDPVDHLGLLGTNGLTAYFGLLEIGDPQPGDVVLVSAAAGSVGHLVGQIAKLKGAKVIGIAGTREKCEMLVDELGFDDAVNHRTSNFRTRLGEATPDRVDVYFDNAGGPVLGAAIRRMKAFGRIVCCGVVSQYDTSTPEPGPRGVPGLLVNNRLRMQGFLVFDFVDRYEQARTELEAWHAAGKIRPKTTTYRGLAQAPQAFVDLLAGRTIGTTVVRV